MLRRYFNRYNWLDKELEVLYRLRIETNVSDCSPSSELMWRATFEKPVISTPNANNQQVFLWQVYPWPLQLVSLVKKNLIV